MSDGPENPVVNIYQETDELVTVRTGDGGCYDACYDEYTGDWLVASDSEGDITVQVWLRTRDGAIQYILQRLGVIEEGTYERAPDRTSA